MFDEETMLDFNPGQENEYSDDGGLLGNVGRYRKAPESTPEERKEEPTVPVPARHQRKLVDRPFGIIGESPEPETGTGIMTSMSFLTFSNPPNRRVIFLASLSPMARCDIF